MHGGKKKVSLTAGVSLILGYGASCMGEKKSVLNRGSFLDFGVLTQGDCCTYVFRMISALFLVPCRGCSTHSPPALSLCCCLYVCTLLQSSGPSSFHGWRGPHLRRLGGRQEDRRIRRLVPPPVDRERVGAQQGHRQQRSGGLCRGSDPRLGHQRRREPVRPVRLHDGEPSQSVAASNLACLSRVWLGKFVMFRAAESAPARRCCRDVHGNQMVSSTRDC